MILVVLFIFLINNFIFEDLSVLASIARAAEEIGQLKITIFGSVCGSRSTFST
ncbi:hypothetical protein SAMN02927900_04227 [Rhizobium mongolense subsp. loessense]|uniref:Uncharacterized protein n=1 Tax=Rhizobium mongolense subsp. loessense TaxID=158890 RepID=A0A1G4SUU2_9HYPH|nr:hypothetical protein SAMN02927900_04227 [Rhizobium mongolense subsp. loessense]